MEKYIVTAISSGANTAEAWRCDEAGNRMERIYLCSLDTSGTNRTLDFEIDGDTIVATDALDASYRLVYDVSAAGRDDCVDPL